MLSDIAIGGDSDIVEEMLRITRHALGMADVEVTGIWKQRCETGPNLHLRRFIEIDDHVAAEDHVKTALEWPLSHQVQFVEGDQLLHLVIDLALAAAVDIHVAE